MEATYGLGDYSNGSATQTLDPVCRMAIDPQKAAGKLNYAGETFYFCSKDCQWKFQENPGAYIGQKR